MNGDTNYIRSNKDIIESTSRPHIRLRKVSSLMYLFVQKKSREFYQPSGDVSEPLKNGALERGIRDERVENSGTICSKSTWILTYTEYIAIIDL